MTHHKEAQGLVDGICVDCQYIYECTIKEQAEVDRGNHVTECTQFKEAK